MTKNLAELDKGKSATIVDIKGGFGFIKKTENLGIRPGKKVTKVSSHFWRGPQVIKIDNTQISLGYGMAKKILVKI